MCMISLIVFTDKYLGLFGHFVFITFIYVTNSPNWWLNRTVFWSWHPKWHPKHLKTCLLFRYLYPDDCIKMSKNQSVIQITAKIWILDTKNYGIPTNLVFGCPVFGSLLYNFFTSQSAKRLTTFYFILLSFILRRIKSTSHFHNHKTQWSAIIYYCSLFWTGISHSLDDNLKI